MTQFEESALEAVAANEVEAPITIDRARRYYLESVEASAENDRACREDAAYYHNKQLSNEILAKLAARGQPPIFVNKITPAITGILGIIDAAQTDPQCYPRSPDQQDTADLATKILRYLNDAADMDTKRATLSKDFFIYGTCAAVVADAAYEGCERLEVTPIHWENFFADPLSRDHDFSDANYMGQSNMFDASKVRTMYPEAYEKLGNPWDRGGSAWFNNKGSIDEQAIWIDRSRRRIRVIELYYRDDSDEWMHVVFCEAGFLHFGPSAYVDDKGKRICPIQAASYEVNRMTGERYGPIRAMKPLQNEVNARRSKLINETNNHRIRQMTENVDPKAKEIAKREAPKANGVMPYGWDWATVTDIAQGQVLLLEIAERDLDRLAPTPAILGRMGGSDSGRAKQILQQAGYTEWARSFSYFTKLEEGINRKMWFAAKQFMTTPQWIRVTGEARAPEFIQVNVPVGMRHVLALDPNGQPMVDPATGQPTLQAVPIMERAVSQMDVDIILATVPDEATLQHETTQEILRYAGSTGVSPMDPAFKALLMMFLQTDKTRTLEKWDAIRAEMQQEQAAQMAQQQQQMQMQQQLQAMQIQARAEKDSAIGRKADADAAKTTHEIAKERTDMQAAAMFSPMQPTQPPFFPN